LGGAVTAVLDNTRGAASVAGSCVAVVALLIGGNHTIAANRCGNVAFLIFRSIHRAADEAGAALVGATTGIAFLFALFLTFFLANAFACADIA
jgi:hypothetical protein